MPLSIVFIAFGWSTDSPCNSHTNCSRLKFLTSCSLRGQLNFPFSSLLYSMINPSPSHSRAFSRSLRLPQNKNRLSENRSRSNSSRLAYAWTALQGSPRLIFWILTFCCPRFLGGSAAVLRLLLQSLSGVLGEFSPDKPYKVYDFP